MKGATVNAYQHSTTCVNPGDQGDAFYSEFGLTGHNANCPLQNFEIFAIFSIKSSSKKAVCSSRPLLLRIKSGSHHKMTFSLLETEIDSWTDWRLTVEMNKKAVLSRRLPRDARYIVYREALRRYGNSKLSKMAAAAILNLFESKIAPLDPPSPNPTLEPT